MTTFKEIVLAGLRQEASDIHMTYGLPPIFRVDGVLSAFGEERLDDAYIMNVLGQLATAAHHLGDLLTLTPEGEYAIASFAHHIPISRRGLIDAQAPRWKEQFRTEQLNPAHSFTLQDGRICLRLRLLEGSSSLLEILITLSPDALPTFLEKRWQNAAHAVYSAVSLRLAQGFDPAAPCRALPESAAIEQIAPQEWLLSLVDSAERPAFTLLLPLADEALARHCASRWPDCQHSLREYILHELHRNIPA
jgi:hypothetical protein